MTHDLFDKSKYGKSKPRSFRFPKHWWRAIEDLADRKGVTATDIILERTKDLFDPSISTPEPLQFVKEMIEKNCGPAADAINDRVGELEKLLEDSKKEEEELRVKLSANQQNDPDAEADNKLLVQVESLIAENNSLEQQLRDKNFEIEEINKRYEGLKNYCLDSELLNDIDHDLNLAKQKTSGKNLNKKSLKEIEKILNHLKANMELFEGGKRKGVIEQYQNSKKEIEGLDSAISAIKIVKPKKKRGEKKKKIEQYNSHIRINGDRWNVLHIYKSKPIVKLRKGANTAFLFFNDHELRMEATKEIVIVNVNDSDMRGMAYYRKSFMEHQKAKKDGSTEKVVAENRKGRPNE